MFYRTVIGIDAAMAGKGLFYVQQEKGVQDPIEKIEDARFLISD